MREAMKQGMFAMCGLPGCTRPREQGVDMCRECADWVERELDGHGDLDAPEWRGAAEVLEELANSSTISNSSVAVSPEKERRVPVQPRVELGVIVHHYPARTPLRDVFPRLTMRERLILASGLAVFAAAAGYALWSVARAVVMAGLQLSGGLR